MRHVRRIRPDLRYSISTVELEIMTTLLYSPFPLQQKDPPSRHNRINVEAGRTPRLISAWQWDYLDIVRGSSEVDRKIDAQICERMDGSWFSSKHEPSGLAGLALSVKNNLEHTVSLWVASSTRFKQNPDSFHGSMLQPNLCPFDNLEIPACS